MNLLKVMTFCSLVMLLVSCQVSTKTTSNAKDVSAERVVQPTNKSSVTQKNNVFEIQQDFKSGEANLVGEELDFDLEQTAGGMLSAYSEDKGDYKLSFRTLEEGSWSDWRFLDENLEVNNPSRKAFSPQNLTANTKKIQFRSSGKTHKPVIFRVFTFAKN